MQPPLHNVARNMPKSKFFRVAVEGATTDGRTIERAWLTQMAANFDPQKYGARLWLEHIRGTVPESPFKAYGDVTALKAEEIDLDGKKKMALFAQIDPTPDLIGLNKARQKIYTSMEINPKFGDSGQAYLVGLGITDSPASLGTEILSFASQHPASNPFKGKKQAEDNLFTEAVEFSLEIEEDPADDSKTSGALKGMRDAIAKFTGRFKKQDGDLGEIVGAVGEMATAFGEFADQSANDRKELGTLKKDFATLQAEHTSLKAKFEKIDTTDASRFSQRQPATGGNPSQQLTDC